MNILLHTKTHMQSESKYLRTIIKKKNMNELKQNVNKLVCNFSKI